MKKIFWITPILLLAACSVEEPASIENNIYYPAEVTASIDDYSSTPETKVYLDESLKVLWTNDDRISLFNKYTYNKEYRFSGSTGANSGVFKEVSSGEVIVGNALDYVYAVYPYDELTEISNSGMITLDLPSEQAYAENSFGLGANTMVSATTNTELLFKNLCGYVVLKLYGDGVSVSSITFKGNNGEVLAGTADITAAVGSNPALSFRTTGTSDSITLNCATPVELGATAEDATVFWLVVPPMTFTQGFTITVTDPDGNTFEKSTSSSKEVVRNRPYRMGALEVQFEPVITIPVPEPIDLGLSVKWASFNLGASAPEETGYKFAWGETEPKSKFSWETYKWCNGTENSLTKYNSNSEFGVVDNKSILDEEDDAAHVLYGGHWRMPTRDEANELYTYCEMEVNYTDETVTFISNINGKAIVFPMNSYRNLVVWTKSLSRYSNTPVHAAYISNVPNDNDCPETYRYTMANIRAVIAE